MMSRMLKVGAVLVLAGLFANTVLAAEGDVSLGAKDAKQDLPSAVFPHWIHRIRYTCSACHPILFEMKAGSNPVTMDAISSGKFCGACHNGEIAWSVTFETCNRCHLEQ